MGGDTEENGEDKVGEDKDAGGGGEEIEGEVGEVKKQVVKEGEQEDEGGGLGLSQIGETINRGMGELKEQFLGEKKAVEKNLNQFRQFMDRTASNVGQNVVNVDLGKLGTNLGKGVGELKENFVHSIEHALESVETFARDEEDGEKGGDEVGVGENDIPTTRFQQRIRELQSSLKSFSEGIENEKEEYNRWRDEDFKIDSVEKECMEILERYEAVANFYERTVPNNVEEEEFWARYFWRKRKLEMEEEKRKKLLEGAGDVQENKDEDWGDDWGDDGEEDENEDEGEEKEPSKDEKAEIEDEKSSVANAEEGAIVTDESTSRNAIQNSKKKSRGPRTDAEKEQSSADGELSKQTLANKSETKESVETAVKASKEEQKEKAEAAKEPTDNLTKVVAEDIERSSSPKIDDNENQLESNGNEGDDDDDDDWE